MTHFFKSGILTLLLASAALAQQTATPATAAEVGMDTSAMVKETQQIDQHSSKMGLFWWVPVEFWEQSAMKSGISAEEARQYFKPLRDYNMFLIGIGTLRLGTIDWRSDADVRKSIVLRDQAGNTYKPLETVSADARSFNDILKPMFKNMLGQFGEGVRIIYFPIKDSTGNIFADPRRSSEFSLVVTGLIDSGNNVYTWRLPLSSMTPPRYCPVGKEKLDASWKYCPWHGNKLEDTAVAPAPVKPK